MASGGLGQATICANSDTALFRACLGDGRCLGIDVNYAEDTMPRGPAGCIRDVMAQTRRGTFVVVEGGTLPSLNLDELLAAHRGTKAALTIVLSPESNEDCPGRPLGIYIVEAEAIDQVPEHGFQDIKERLIPDLYRAGHRIATVVASPGSPLRVTDAASYLAVNAWATEQMVRDEGVRGDGSSVSPHGSRVASSARVVGPVWMGPRCVIGPGAIIIGPTCIGAGCEIGAGAVISRSALWDGCRVGAGSIVDHSVVTVGASVEPEAVLRSAFCVSPSPAGTPVVDWLMSRCWAAPDGVRNSPAARADSVLPLAS
jgi:mannose-1-phosphate guanylyltransferase